MARKSATRIPLSCVCTRLMGLIKPLIISLYILTHQRCNAQQQQFQLQTNQNQQINQQQPYCTLGDDVFQIGERWNPVLDPFGVQVCVLCECTIRQKKNCYEVRVTCRKITGECPIIHSCPDGKEPITIAGQCCKSCHSSSEISSSGAGVVALSSQLTTTNSSATRVQATQSSPTSNTTASPPPTAPRVQQYVNERTKEYMSMVRNLQACTNGREADKHTSPAPVKSPKKNRNDINGLDTRLAFKSLGSHESYPFKTTTTLTSVSSKAATSEAESAPDLQDNQQPNDVQPTSSEFEQSPGAGHNSAGSGKFRSRSDHRAGSRQRDGTQQAAEGEHFYLSPPSAGPMTPANSCLLGNDSFHIGDMWHPILYPFGAQECVLCSCNIRKKKSCYEPKLACIRVDDFCTIKSSKDTCPDGQAPIKVDGQCCWTCPSAAQQTAASSGDSADPEVINVRNSLSTTAAAAATVSLYAIQRNETVYKELKAFPRSYQSCRIPLSKRRKRRMQFERATINTKNPSQPGVVATTAP